MAQSNKTMTNLKKAMRGRNAWIGGLLGACVLGGVLYVAMHHHGDAAQDEHAAPEQTQAAAPAAEPVKEAAAAQPAAPVLPETEPVVHFAYNSAALDSGTKSSLDAWAKKLGLDRQLRLELDGHCDERGSVAYNMSLGQQRADAAKDYLVAQGVDGNRLSTVSFGKAHPVNPGHDEASWAENRRVEMHEVTALSQR